MLLRPLIASILLLSAAFAGPDLQDADPKGCKGCGKAEEFADIHAKPFPKAVSCLDCASKNEICVICADPLAEISREPFDLETFLAEGRTFISEEKWGSYPFGEKFPSHHFIHFKYARISWIVEDLSFTARFIVENGQIVVPGKDGDMHAKWNPEGRRIQWLGKWYKYHGPEPKETPAPCPACKKADAVIPVVECPPNPAVLRMANRGEVVVSEKPRDNWHDGPRWHCKTCKKRW